MKWTGEYRVNANDVDVTNVVSASNILKIMQDAATSAMEADGPSYDELMERGLSFVLSRLRISCYAPLHTHDRLEGQSWACESRGAQFNRCYRLLRDGVIVAEGVSAWALVGLRDRKLHRVTEFNFPYRQDEMIELDLPARFRIPEGADLVLTGERTVEYADIDMNGHMNNTRYPDVLCSYLGTDMRGQRVISMGIAFLSEAPLGESIKYYAGQSDGIYYIRTVRENGQTGAEAEIMLEPLDGSAV